MHEALLEERHKSEAAIAQATKVERERARTAEEEKQRALLALQAAEQRRHVAAEEMQAAAAARGLPRAEAYVKPVAARSEPEPEPEPILQPVVDYELPAATAAAVQFVERGGFLTMYLASGEFHAIVPFAPCHLQISTRCSGCYPTAAVSALFAPHVSHSHGVLGMSQAR
eukprot:COSAG05_NODE_963_length_6408_cov_4.077984_3_plen_170_part_00